MKNFAAAMIVGTLAIYALPALSEPLPNSTAESSYFSVMSKAGGIAPVRQEPVEPAKCDKPAEGTAGYSDSYYNSIYYSEAAPAAEPPIRLDDSDPRYSILSGAQKRRLKRDLEREARAREWSAPQAGAIFRTSRGIGSQTLR